MRVIGIDPSLTSTGFGIIENKQNNTEVIIAGIIKTSSKETIQGRLNKIYSHVLDIITEHKPDILVLEKVYSHYKYPATAISLGYARGAICLASGQAKIPIKDYSAKRIKKAVTGKGNASKKQVQKMIQHLLHLKKTPEPDDVSDALALALGYLYLNKKEALKNDIES
jgi:crossover junction endodeoxyribonuclease RuvC